MMFYRAYLYGVIAKFRWESGFFFGSYRNPPWAPTGVKVPWSLKAALFPDRKFRFLLKSDML